MDQISDKGSKIPREITNNYPKEKGNGRVP